MRIRSDGTLLLAPNRPDKQAIKAASLSPLNPALRHWLLCEKRALGPDQWLRSVSHLNRAVRVHVHRHETP